MTPPPPKNYKRSWKNLLINKRYQLQFTLFMVGLSTLLMAGLGIWVMKVANETTTVSMASVRGTPCPKVPGLTDPSEDQLAPVPMKLPDNDSGLTPAPEPAPAPGATPAPELPTPPASDPAPTTPKADPKAVGSAGSGDGTGSDEPHRTQVVMEDSSMTMIPTAAVVPADFGAKVVAHWTCELRLAGQIRQLQRGRALILWVLISTGLLLVIGLAFYGIKMTHKVAGPLFKVSLYLAKMKDGRFDKVWNLRKGDQLVDFYDHFKTAHAGVVQMQNDDIAQIKNVIAAAEAANAGDHATVVALRELLARKEKSIE